MRSLTVFSIGVVLSFLGISPSIGQAAVTPSCKSEMLSLCPKKLTGTIQKNFACVKRSIPALSTHCQHQYFQAFGTTSAWVDKLQTIRDRQQNQADSRSLRSQLANPRNLKEAPAAPAKRLLPLESHRRLALKFLIVCALFLYTICFWRLFEMGGFPGWYTLVPGLNLFVIVRLSGRSGWQTILWFIPVANVIFYFAISLDIAVKKGRSPYFGIGLAACPMVFYPLLVFE